MTPRERLFALEHFGIKLGLDNIRTLIEALGHPQRGGAVVHVAGTNGKGSVSAMVERGLRAAGWRTGRYTSPHLAAIEERIALDGRPVSAQSFDEVTADVLDLVDRLRAAGNLDALPTFFEVTTAMAFELFRRAGVQVAVIEVGLGGRFDATNVVDPLVTAITTIALDHERHLGHSIEQIAAEKAGIIKPGVPVVAGRMPEAARRVIGETACARSAEVIDAVPPSAGEPVTLALPGRHQHDNAAVAVAVLAAVHARGLQVQRADVRAALTDVDWPGRLEWLRLPDGAEILLDAAHNPAGAAALADYVRDTCGTLPLVLGVAPDKDARGMIAALAPAASRIIATQAPTARALDAAELARLAAVSCDLPVTHTADPETGVADAAAAERRAMVAGSILLIGPLRARLLARGAVPVRYPSTATPFLLP